MNGAFKGIAWAGFAAICLGIALVPWGLASSVTFPGAGALIFGIVAVAGAFFCVLPILVSPVAWVLGAQARREIRSAPQQWGGEGRATAGMVLGIVGTVLLVLGLLAIALFVIVAVSSSSSVDGTGVGA